MTLSSLLTSDVTNVFLNTDDFAETAVFHCPSGPVTLTVMIEVDEAIRDDEGQTAAMYTGQLYVAESDVEKLERDKQYPLTATFRGNKWHITDSGSPYHGWRAFGIKRQERKYSNAITLDGKQKRYGKLSPNP